MVGSERGLFRGIAAGVVPDPAFSENGNFHGVHQPCLKKRCE